MAGWSRGYETDEPYGPGFYWEAPPLRFYFLTAFFNQRQTSRENMTRPDPASGQVMSLDLVDAPNPSNHFPPGQNITPTLALYNDTGATAGKAWTGVVRIADGYVSASGVLLTSGLHILTAAHVVQSLDLTSTTVFVESNGLSEQLDVLTATVYPGATINRYGVWNDLAILTLTQAAPTGAQRYDLYTGEGEAGRNATLTGYGQAQTPYGESLGQTTPTRRVGENRIDTTGDKLRAYWSGSLAQQLWFDFDDGTFQHDALGQILGEPDPGLGRTEAMLTLGDSGGGLFIQESGSSLLAGINSFVTRWAAADVDTEANGSIGDIGIATRVSSYSGWIERQTGQTQIPVAQDSRPPDTAQVPMQVMEGEGVWFLVQLGARATALSNVEFATRDGTAQAGEDYVPTRGVLTLEPGEHWAKIWVQTLADNRIEGDETFYLVLTNPTGASFPKGMQELTAARNIVDDVTLVGVTQLVEWGTG